MSALDHELDQRQALPAQPVQFPQPRQADSDLAVSGRSVTDVN